MQPSFKPVLTIPNTYSTRTPPKHLPFQRGLSLTCDALADLGVEKSQQIHLPSIRNFGHHHWRAWWRMYRIQSRRGSTNGWGGENVANSESTWNCGDLPIWDGIYQLKITIYQKMWSSYLNHKRPELSWAAKKHLRMPKLIKPPTEMQTPHGQLQPDYPKFKSLVKLTQGGHEVRTCNCSQTFKQRTYLNISNARDVKDDQYLLPFQQTMLCTFTHHSIP